MELQSLEKLESQVTQLLEQYSALKQERDDLSERVKQMESESAQLREQIDAQEAQLEEARRNARDPEKERRIKNKVDELLAKLEGY